MTISAQWRASARPDLPPGRAFVDSTPRQPTRMLGRTATAPSGTAPPRSGLALAHLPTSHQRPI